MKLKEIQKKKLHIFQSKISLWGFVSNLVNVNIFVVMKATSMLDTLTLFFHLYDLLDCSRISTHEKATVNAIMTLPHA